MREILVIICIFVGLTVGLLLFMSVSASRKTSAMQKTLGQFNSSVNQAGQFVEAMNESEMKIWLSSHSQNRKIIALTGVGTGAYGTDDYFIVVSEPCPKTPEKP